MDFQKFAARTVDEAITKACVELAIPSDKLEYEVETEGREGFFGIGSRNAVIRARVKEAEKEAPEEAAPVTAEAEPEKAQPPKQEKAPKNEEKKPRVKTAEEIEAMAQAAAKRAAEAGEVPEEKEPAPRREKKNDRRSDRRRGQKTREKRPVPEVREKEAEEADLSAAPKKPEKEVPVRTEEEIAAMTRDADKFLTDVLRAMEMTVEKDIRYDKETGVLSCEFSGDEMGLLIGKRGQTLDSLQYLTSLVVNKNQKEYVRVKLDTEEYRRRRRETLEVLSRNIAFKVKRTHKAVVLEPMNPYERRIIHSTLQSSRYVETYSEGEEPFRRVIVAPKRNAR